KRDRLLKMAIQKRGRWTAISLFSFLPHGPLKGGRVMEVIETERLRLRTIEEKDVNPIVELASDYEVAKMLATMPHPYKRSDAEAFMMRLHDQTARGSALVYAIDREGFIGMIGISEIDQSYGKKSGTLGYWLGRPFWGRGVATEATRALVEHAFR